MKIKLVDIDDKKLKDYLVIIGQIKEAQNNKTLMLLEKTVRLEKGKERDELCRMIIEANLRNIVQIANRYRGAGITFARLLKAGNKAMIETVRDWSDTDVSRFDAYFVWTVEGAMIDEIIKNKSKEVQKKR